MMEAVRISETSVYFNVTTKRHIPEDCNHDETYMYFYCVSVLKFIVPTRQFVFELRFVRPS
jgi:hypothetical protein